MSGKIKVHKKDTQGGSEGEKYLRALVDNILGHCHGNPSVENIARESLEELLSRVQRRESELGRIKLNLAWRNSSYLQRIRRIYGAKPRIYSLEHLGHHKHRQFSQWLGVLHSLTEATSKTLVPCRIVQVLGKSIIAECIVDSNPKNVETRVFGADFFDEGYEVEVGNIFAVRLVNRSGDTKPEFEPVPPPSIAGLFQTREQLLADLGREFEELSDSGIFNPLPVSDDDHF